VSKEIVKRLYSTESEVRKDAVYQILFERHHELIGELKQAAAYEKKEEIALLIAQTCLALEAFPRDPSMERQILEMIQTREGIAEMSLKFWKYMSTNGSSKMLIAVMGAMNETIPTNAQQFIETCLNHLDPQVRAMACTVAINSGRPTHFSYILNLITDPDQMVAETAFRVIKELPAEQMNIILDYALGSPDEWVLQNVAPFLPLLITNESRKVVAKVQYHHHPLVAKKAREALKQLDSIPFVSKRLKEKHKAKAQAESESAAKTVSSESASEETSQEGFASFKEQMEEKRRLRMKQEQEKRDKEERLNRELEETTEEEIASFANEMKDFQEELKETTGEEIAPMVEADEPLLENLDFENEQAVLEKIEENDLDLSSEQPPEKPTTPELSAASDEITAEKPESAPEHKPVKIIETSTENEKPATDGLDEALTAAAEEIIDFEAETEQISPEIVPGEKSDTESSLEQETEKNDESLKSEEKGTAQFEPEYYSDEDIDIEVSEEDIEIDDEDIETGDEDIEITVLDEQAETQPRQPGKKMVVKERPGRKVKPDEILVPPMPAAQTILKRYPSFLTDPLSTLFKPATKEVHLKNIGRVTDNLLAYLNLCFLQSCMFFAPGSDMITRSIKDCLKGHLTGPTALRCLHNFALGMKQSREKPVFFTFSLATIFSESSDTNPLMLLRELKEYLKDPIEPLHETIPQAIEGLTEILRAIKSIQNNSIVMKAPKGAREPYADLGGPLANVLPKEKRPGIELPPGEAVVLSRDGTEAFGLYPYFKYSKRKLHFARPTDPEFKILLDRLEISLN
jgi:hypothetical protein